METELNALPADIDLEGNSPVDIYTNKKPKQKPSKSIWLVLGIVILILTVVTVIIAVIICCSCRQSNTRQEKGLRHIDSDTSNIS